MNSTESLNDFVSKVWCGLESYQRDGYPSNLFKRCSQRQIEKFIRVAFDASLYSEEGRPTQTRLALEAERSIVPFGENIELTAKSIAKLAPLVNLSRRQFVVKCIADDLQITGIRDPFYGLRRWPNVVPESNVASDYLLISIDGPAHLIVSGLVAYELRKVECHVVKPLYNSKSIMNWLKSGNDEQLGSFWRNRALESMVRQTRELGRGGCFLIGKPSVSTCKVLEGGTSISGDFLMKAIEKRRDCEKVFLNIDDADAVATNEAHFAHNDFEQAIKLAASLASIDGAVFMTRDWDIHRFGVKITAKPVHHDDVAKRGTRHSSAYAFCKNTDDAIAIVVSQDGDVSVMSSEFDGGYESVTLDEAWIDRA